MIREGLQRVCTRDCAIRACPGRLTSTPRGGSSLTSRDTQVCRMSAYQQNSRIYTAQIETQYKIAERGLTQEDPRTTKPSPRPLEPEPVLAHELVQGTLVKYCSPASRCPPTAVLIHGIMGSRRNMHSFAQRLVKGFPNWQVLLVDLRCHGDSAALTAELHDQDHSVESAARDVLNLLQSLKMFPEVLIGHSFGGKVVMSMADQFGSGVKRLPKPVDVWVLDALPGEIRSEEMGAQDKPADLIATLRGIPMPIARKADLVKYLERIGFSQGIAAWAGTNLVPSQNGIGVTWKFDLNCISAMYRSYEKTNLWPFLVSPAEGIRVSFVKAEKSSFRWSGPDQEMLEQYGHKVHLLRNSGHWVHTENPHGLFDILTESFGIPDIHVRVHNASY